MIWGLMTSTFTTVHVVISLVVKGMGWLSIFTDPTFDWMRRSGHSYPCVP